MADYLEKKQDKYQPAPRNYEYDLDKAVEFVRGQSELLPALGEQYAQAQRDKYFKDALADVGQIGAEYVSRISGQPAQTGLYEGIRRRAAEGVARPRRDISEIKDLLLKVGGMVSRRPDLDPDMRAATLAQKRAQTELAKARTKAAGQPKKSPLQDLVTLLALQQKREMYPIKLKTAQEEYKQLVEKPKKEKREALESRRKRALERLREGYKGKVKIPGGRMIEQELYIPGVGIGVTKKDADELKKASELKKGFDREINELIALREKHGFTISNREAISRANQLSKKLILKYKTLAGLGVLSQADERILDAIFPPAPLSFNPAQLRGQDPILSNLEAFKRDTQADYEEKLGLRLRERFDQPGLEYTDPEDGVRYRYIGPEPRTDKTMRDQENWERVGG